MRGSHVQYQYFIKEWAVKTGTGASIGVACMSDKPKRCVKYLTENPSRASVILVLKLLFGRPIVSF